MSVISDPEEALPEPVSAQSSEDRSREATSGGLDVGECEKRAGEMLGVCTTQEDLCLAVAQGLLVPLSVSPRMERTTALCLAAWLSHMVVPLWLYLFS